MHVVLPEIDGRLLTTAVSFKTEAEALPGLDFTRVVNCPDPDGIALAADRALGWARLAATPRVGASDRDCAVGLSRGWRRPGRARRRAGHLRQPGRPSSRTCGPRATIAVAELTWNLWRSVFATPNRRRSWIYRLTTGFSLHCRRRPRRMSPRAWGEPATLGGAFMLRHVILGRLVVAVQPDRGSALDRKASYHDPDLPPCHAYVAFYLWLRRVLEVDALVHLGTHGTLEWLPGKSVALSAACTPRCFGRRAAGDLSVHRQQPRRGRRRQAPSRGGDDRPPDTAAEGGRHARRGRRTGTADRRIRRRRRAGQSPCGAAAPRDPDAAPTPPDCWPKAAWRATRRTTRRSPGSTPICAMSRTCKSATGCTCSAGRRRRSAGRCCWMPCCVPRPAWPRSAWTRRWIARAPAERAALLAALDWPIRRAGSGRGADPRPGGRAADRAQPVHHRSARGADPLGADPGGACRGRVAATAFAGPRRMAALAGDRPVGQRHHAHRRRGFRPGAGADGRAAGVG